MRSDLRPYPVKRLHRLLEAAYVRQFIAPQLDSVGPHLAVMKPWNLKIHGANIHIGNSVHIITAADRRVVLTSWQHEPARGHIRIGDYCLISPGVRLQSACGITIGDNSMLAASVYVTDADWHGIYDRSQPVGKSAPVELGNNVWVGDGATVCKGVTIGDNSVIGAGSVVTSNIPPNVIAAGNPARVVRDLDPSIGFTRREHLLQDAAGIEQRTNELDRYLLGANGWLRWLRSLVNPRQGD